MNLANVSKRLDASEGRTSYLYLCTGGKVTVGRGHALDKVDDARSFRFEIDGRAATDTELRRDYVAVAGAKKGMVASYYASLTKCRMTEAEIQRLADYDVSVFLRALKAKLPNFDSYAESVQEALFDMAFNLGLAGLLKFKHLMACVGAGAWAIAATECHRNGISDERNAETAELFKQAVKA